MRKLITLALLLLIIFLPNQLAFAQDGEPNGPIYVIEPGDTYYSIAIKFGVTVDDLAKANPDVDPNFLSVGQGVVIPGLEGVRGKLMTETIPLGETLRTLAIRNQVAEDQVVKLNRITSPAEVFAGVSLIIPQVENANPPHSSYLLGQNESVFQLAARENVNPWLLTEINQQQSAWSVLPGEALFDAAAEGAEEVSLISPAVKSLTVNPLPIEQGMVSVVTVVTTQPVTLTGTLAGRELRFFPNGENTYVALQGVHVMSEPGIYPITVHGALADGTQFNFEQMLVLKTLGYVQEKIDGVDPATIDPANTKPEEDQVKAIITPATPEKMWNGVWMSPGYDPTWITSTFGNRRSYNGGPYSWYHTGLDYGGGTGLPIKAPAPGVVVFAGPLTVRGNATIIDHGWGVYSGFWHQSEFQVKVGDRVETGQVIGLIGATGRVTGAHLHWEIWVNGVHVDPYAWMEKTYP